MYWYTNILIYKYTDVQIYWYTNMLIYKYLQIYIHIQVYNIYWISNMSGQTSYDVIGEAR